MASPDDGRDGPHREGFGADQMLGIGAFVMLHIGILWMLGPQPVALLFVALLWMAAAVLVYALKE